MLSLTKIVINVKMICMFVSFQTENIKVGNYISVSEIIDTVETVKEYVYRIILFHI